MRFFKFIYLCVMAGLAGGLLGKTIMEATGLGFLFAMGVYGLDVLCEAIRGKPL